MKRVRLLRNRSKPEPFDFFRQRQQRSMAGLDGRRAARRRLLSMVEMMRPMSSDELATRGEIKLRQVLVYALGNDFAVSFVTSNGTVNMTCKPDSIKLLAHALSDLAERRIRNMSHDQEI